MADGDSAPYIVASGGGGADPAALYEAELDKLAIGDWLGQQVYENMRLGVPRLPLMTRLPSVAWCNGELWMVTYYGGVHVLRNGSWVQHSANTPPNYQTAMVGVDATNELVVLDAPDTVLVYDIDAGTWSSHGPFTNFGYDGHMAYDSARGELIILSQNKTAHFDVVTQTMNANYTPSISDTAIVDYDPTSGLVKGVGFDPVTGGEQVFIEYDPTDGSITNTATGLTGWWDVSYSTEGKGDDTHVYWMTRTDADASVGHLWRMEYATNTIEQVTAEEYDPWADTTGTFPPHWGCVPDPGGHVCYVIGNDTSSSYADAVLIDRDYQT